MTYGSPDSVKTLHTLDVVQVTAAASDGRKSYNVKQPREPPNLFISLGMKFFLFPLLDKQFICRKM